ncbi:CCA tRNA nucleotidyltransferase [Sediminibacillus massiliensis]|uniref:CCA tRNA nucleotidyltransferase n=1 Tax=Sediminibacillus massiliensis TaxID=1926277 RepID=UPI0009885331|nr:CCA tRNA nucleotidyltransferase [Sediminibacillus massiliensis]
MVPDSFSSAEKILEKLEMNGYKAYFVGGAVRDLLLGRKVGDIDITTSARPEEVQALFHKVIPVGIEHGTVIVRMDGESFETTTFRVEAGYSDFRHPDRVGYVDNIEEDLSRRDFTINAMAMDRRGNIIDPFRGRDDIESGLIQTVGQPVERFQEDPLRMMRAVRFCSQLGFSIEQTTLHALQAQAPLLKNIAVERIAVELEKMFQGSNVREGAGLLKQSGLTEYFPVFSNNQSFINQLAETAVPLSSFREMLCFFVEVLPAVPVDDWVKEWKLSNRVGREAKLLSTLLRQSRRHGIGPWLVYQLPGEMIPGFASLYSLLVGSITERELRRLKEGLPIKDRKQLSINGNDLVDMYPERKKGAWIKECLDTIERYVVTGEISNNKQDIKEWIRNHDHTK